MARDDVSESDIPHGASIPSTDCNRIESSDNDLEMEMLAQLSELLSAISDTHENVWVKVRENSTSIHIRDYSIDIFTVCSLVCGGSFARVETAFATDSGKIEMTISLSPDYHRELQYTLSSPKSTPSIGVDILRN